MEGELTVEAYDKLAEAHRFLDISFVKKLLKNGISGKVLDVGSGTGIISLELKLKSHALNVSLLDISGDMIEYSKKKFISNGIVDGVSFFVSNGINLPFENEHFDFVYSHHVLHHVSDPKIFLTELYRIVKKGGSIFVRDLKRPKRDSYLSFYFNIFGSIYNKLPKDLVKQGKKEYYDSLRAAYTLKEIEKILKQTGIKEYESHMSSFIEFHHYDIICKAKL